MTWCVYCSGRRQATTHREGLPACPPCSNPAQLDPGQYNPGSPVNCRCDIDPVDPDEEDPR